MKVLKPVPAQAMLRIKTGGLAPVECGLDFATIEVGVDVLFETPEAYVVDYWPITPQQREALACSDIVRKDDKTRKLTYTQFTATTDRPVAGKYRRGQCSMTVLAPMDGFIDFNNVKCEVFVVEETESHYRLRFSPSMAKMHPNLCSEWVLKDERWCKITITSELLDGTA